MPREPRSRASLACAALTVVIGVLGMPHLLNAGLSVRIFDSPGSARNPSA